MVSLLTPVFLESTPRERLLGWIAMSLDSVVATGFMVTVRCMISKGETSL
jgi:hypothetical protein